MSKARALELKQRLQKLPKSFPDNEQRVLIREGVLFIEEDHKLKPRWCFLFNDCFLGMVQQRKYVQISKIPIFTLPPNLLSRDNHHSHLPPNTQSVSRRAILRYDLSSQSLHLFARSLYDQI